MTFARNASVALLLAGLASSAQADVFLRGEVTLRAAEDYGRYELVADVPAGVEPSGELVLPGDCREVQAQTFSANGERVLTWAFDCPRHLGPGDRLVLPLTLDATAVRIDDGETVTKSVVTGDVEFDVAAPVHALRTFGAVAADYLRQGVHHIWVGWDHLAFVLCLCFVARGVRRLLLLITAFTVGHSVSMALSFLGVIEIAVPPIEAIIAMSIVWMAREALVTGRRESAGSPEKAPSDGRYFVVVSGFGLIHGLGFASALDQLGVAAGERIAALAFFNLGVEVGQVLFVLAVTMAVRALAGVSFDRPVARFALYAVGCIGSFWMIERVAGFGWT